MPANNQTIAGMARSYTPDYPLPTDPTHYLIFCGI